ELTCHAHRSLGIKIENHPSFNIASDVDEGRDTLAAIGVLFHVQAAYGNRGFQPLRQDGICRIDKRLYQLHFHGQTPAPAALPTVASSPSTYLITSYRTSGFTGFCTKCRAPRCRAATIFSWYPTEETITIRASGCCTTIFSAASIPSI